MLLPVWIALIQLDRWSRESWRISRFTIVTTIVNLLTGLEFRWCVMFLYAGSAYKRVIPMLNLKANVPRDPSADARDDPDFNAVILSREDGEGSLRRSQPHKFM